jgi:hypothetical protein
VTGDISSLWRTAQEAEEMPVPGGAKARLCGACTPEAAAALRGVKSRRHLRLVFRFGGGQRQDGPSQSKRRFGVAEAARRFMAALGSASCRLKNIVESSGAR